MSARFPLPPRRKGLANLNRIILVGRLIADPESRNTVEGLPMAKFRLAIDRPVMGGGTEADLVDIVAWRRLAEVSAENLKKGLLVLVEGRIQNRSFEDQTGQRRWTTEVIASNLTLLEKADPKQQKAVEIGAGSTFAEESKEEDVVDDDDLGSDLPF